MIRILLDGFKGIEILEVANNKKKRRHLILQRDFNYAVQPSFFETVSFNIFTGAKREIDIYKM